LLFSGTDDVAEEEKHSTPTNQRRQAKKILVMYKEIGVVERMTRDSVMQFDSESPRYI
jgi:hypothetical protein